MPGPRALSRFPRFRIALFTAGLLGSSAPGCAGEEPVLESEIVVGLRLTGAAQAGLDDHLVELLVHEGHVYAANSNLGVATMRIETDGELTLTDAGAKESDLTRCTTLALHEPSSTLYCAADSPMAVAEIVRFDVSAPHRAERIGALPVVFPVKGFRDISVLGDRLILNAFDEGLWTADIGVDGSLGEMQPTGVEGLSRFSVGVEGGLVSAFASEAGQGGGTQLRLLDVETWELKAQLDLDGPPLGLSSDGQGRLAVAQGSRGMAVVEVGAEGLSEGRRIQPPGVVSHALVDGSMAYAITLSGAFAYALDGEGEGEGKQARLFGFAPESVPGPERRGNMLHAVLHEGALLTSDWTWVERWAVDPQGEAAALDLPRGVYLRGGEPARWRVRNPGAVELRADFVLRGARRFSVNLLPGGVTDIEIDGVLVDRLMGDAEYRLLFGVRVHDPAVAFEGTPLTTSSFAILREVPELEPPPVPGTVFPPVALGDLDDVAFSLPTPNQARRLVWYSEDCALMWPELEDLIWRSRRGLDSVPPLFISDTNVRSRLATTWGLSDADFGNFGPSAPAEVLEANGPLYGEDLYRAFILAELPGDGLTTDYVLDEDGRIQSVERMYRGPWSLAVSAGE